MEVGPSAHHRQTESQEESRFRLQLIPSRPCAVLLRHAFSLITTCYSLGQLWSRNIPIVPRVLIDGSENTEIQSSPF